MDEIPEEELKQMIEDFTEFIKRFISGAEVRTAYEIEVLSKQKNLTEMEKQYLRMLKEAKEKRFEEEF